MFVCLLACAAGLLRILLTGMKVFRSGGARMRRQEWNNVGGGGMGVRGGAVGIRPGASAVFTCPVI